MEPELTLHLLVHFLDLLLQACQQWLEAAWHLLVHVSPLPLRLGAVEEPRRCPGTGVPRRIWRLDTSSNWWDRIVLERWEDRQWTQNFRMRRDTFLELCEWLAPALRRRDTRMRPAILLQKRVAIALWKLSTPDSYRSIGNQFGVGRSTVGVVLMEVVKAIDRVLLHRVVCLADPDAVIRGFGALGFPNCRGAIDGTHIPIRALEHQASRYVNHKGYFSMILQAVCDHRGQFTDINVGWSGKAHDARVYRNSSVCQRLQDGTFFPDRHIRVGDVDMPVCLVGDAAYPLQPWLMKPYTGHLNPSRQAFNARLTRACIVVEGTFGRLKARFQCLLTRLDLAEHNIPPVVAACCVLHNLCERKGEAFLLAWMAEADRMAGHYGQPRTGAIREVQRGAVQIREALRESFLVEEED